MPLEVINQLNYMKIQVEVDNGIVPDSFEVLLYFLLNFL